MPITPSLGLKMPVSRSEPKVYDGAVSEPPTVAETFEPTTLPKARRSPDRKIVPAFDMPVPASIPDGNEADPETVRLVVEIFVKDEFPTNFDVPLT